MANFSDLPTEIWLLIAQHISTPYLAKLKSLNSLFFNCYMNMRWGRVEIEASSLSVSRVVRDLERMVDPFVATRIKMLTLLLRYFSRSIATTLVTSLPLLPNITSLNIIEKCTGYFAFHFPAIMSSSMTRTLGKLRITVHVDADVLGQLAEHSSPTVTTYFENLTVFFLDLDFRYWSPFPRPKYYFTAPASVLRTLAPILQRLRISDNSKPSDLCPLFDTLWVHNPPIPFPCLNTLVLFFHLDKAEALQASHQSLLRFLIAHQDTLQYLHLNLAVDISTSNPDEEHLGVWLTELASNSRFSSLQTLGICPSNTPAGLSAVLALINRSAPTLTSLTIYDIFLTHEDATRVLDALTENQFQGHAMETSPRLYKSLEMRLFQLSVPFLDLLAYKLPHLEKLSLYVVELVGSDQYSFSDSLLQRSYNPDVTFTQDILHSWKLQNLSIRSGPDSSLDKDAVHAVAGAVPALVRRM